MKKLLFVIVLIGVLAACTQSEKPAPTPAPTTFAVILSCPDCAEIGMKINIWTNPNRSGVAGSVDHNTRAIVYGTQTYDGVLHYNVEALGVRGWVSELMIQK